MIRDFKRSLLYLFLSRIASFASATYLRILKNKKEDKMQSTVMERRDETYAILL